MKICTEVALAIADASRKFNIDAGTATSQDQREFNLDKAKKLLKVLTSLFNSGFSESVMKMAVQHF
jgi:hypothetical protein